MTFIIKGGFDSLKNQIVNIVLQKNNIWNSGIVICNNKQTFNINSKRENKIELIKYHTKYALLLNDMIIYENEKLFMYNINLHIDINENKYHENNIYNVIIYDIINYNDLHDFIELRTLN